MFNYSGLVFDVTRGVCCNFRCQTYLESNSNFFSAHFAELKHLSELLLVDFIFQTLLHAKLCQQTEYDSKGAVRTFFQPELLTLSQGGWGVGPNPKFFLLNRLCLGTVKTLETKFWVSLQKKSERGALITANASK